MSTEDKFEKADVTHTLSLIWFCIKLCIQGNNGPTIPYDSSLINKIHRKPCQKLFGDQNKYYLLLA